MNAFFLTKKEGAVHDPPKGSKTLEKKLKDELNALPIRRGGQHSKTETRYTPYPTASMTKTAKVNQGIPLDLSTPGVCHSSASPPIATITTGTSSFPPADNPAPTLAVTREGRNVASMTRSAQRKNILSLRSRSNPILHSVAPSKSQYISSCSSGHQRGGGGRSTAYMKVLQNKLQLQDEENNEGPPKDSEKPILQGLRVYVSGYTYGTSRSEITRLVTLYGGANLRLAGSATHVITSTGLSRSKFLEANLKKPDRHVVKPEWLFDSIAAGKRLQEYPYRSVSTNVQTELKWGSK